MFNNYSQGSVRIKCYDTSRLTGLSKMISEYSGIAPSANKASVGKNTFTHESEIHVAEILEEPRTYEYFIPDVVGGKRKISNQV